MHVELLKSWTYSSYSTNTDTAKQISGANSKDDNWHIDISLRMSIVLGRLAVALSNVSLRTRARPLVATVAVCRLLSFGPAGAHPGSYDTERIGF